MAPLRSVRAVFFLLRPAMGARPNRFVAFSQLVLAAFCLESGGTIFAQTSVVASLQERTQADQMMIVDCTLPAEVRQLGTGMSYLAPRRATKTSASDCAIRGGEYVAHDRASMASSLRVWLPAATNGDKVAQTYVGEIFEKGVGSAPDHAAAASWYQKAADQNYARALVNLGALHEQGLGVTKDPTKALNLYRKAAGIEGTISLDGSALATQQDVAEIRKELERTRRELDEARKALDRERLKSSSEIETLTKQKLSAAAAGNAAEMQKLEARVKQREAELETRRQQVTRLEQSSDQYKASLSRLETETSSLRASLDAARAQLATSQGEMVNRKDALTDAERKLEATRQEIAKERAAATLAGQDRVKALELELKQRDQAIARQREDIAKFESEIKSNRQRVAAIESKQQAPAPSVAVAPPSITIVDPSIVVTRDTASVTVRPDLKSRQIVGRVSAPAGLLAFTANDVPQEVDADGYFKVSADLTSSKTRMSFVAIDRQGKRATVEFFVERESGVAKNNALAFASLPGLKLGKYYALVIGNQKYEKLGPLYTPEEDAKAISAILKSRYGFTVKTVLNASRHRMMTELNEMRRALTEQDSLLIYYAGHGELDRANALANWLPVDAESDSNANWIASSTITEIINSMSAKHIMVVADSCYSGALTRSSIAQLEGGLSDEARLKWLKSLADSRSRTVLTSGGVSPVWDGGGGKHSVFASTFLHVLSANQDVLEGMRLYREISARVVNAAAKVKFDQRPEYGPIRFAGGETGDFLFVPTQQAAWYERDAVERFSLYGDLWPKLAASVKLGPSP